MVSSSIPLSRPNAFPPSPSMIRLNFDDSPALEKPRMGTQIYECTHILDIWRFVVSSSGKKLWNFVWEFFYLPAMFYLKWISSLPCACNNFKCSRGFSRLLRSSESVPSVCGEKEFLKCDRKCLRTRATRAKKKFLWLNTAKVSKIRYFEADMQRENAEAII